MSTLTRFIKKPMSYTTDAAVSVAVGMLVGAFFQLAIGELLPWGLGDNVSFALGGLVVGVLFVRARRNLDSTPPTYD